MDNPDYIDVNELRLKQRRHWTRNPGEQIIKDKKLKGKSRQTRKQDFKKQIEEELYEDE